MSDLKWKGSWDEVKDKIKKFYGAEDEAAPQRKKPEENAGDKTQPAESGPGV